MPSNAIDLPARVYEKCQFAHAHIALALHLLCACLALAILRLCYNLLMNTKPYLTRYITFGGGVDSTALLVAANLGLCNTHNVDFAIYIDCGSDHPDTISHVQSMQKWSRIPVYIFQTPTSMIDDLLSPNGFVSIPACLWPRGILRRQCTNMYKIKWVHKFVREFIGLKRYQHIKGKVQGLYGINADEAHRAKGSMEKWIDADYPLVTSGFTRADCRELCSKSGLPIPRRSSCICCPLHTKNEWAELKGDGNNPQWKTIIKIDDAIRNRDFEKSGRKCFLSCRFKPISEVNFS